MVCEVDGEDVLGMDIDAVVQKMRGEPGTQVSFKIYRPKHEKAAEPEEDYGGELDGYDGGEPYGDEGDDGPPWDEEDDNGEEADK